MEQPKLTSAPPEIRFERQNYAQIRKRFINVNNARLKRMRQALSPRQQLVLDALPILFHCNHPMLPGFISRQTPHKVSGFKPATDDIAIGKRIARSFTHNLDFESEEAIYSLFVMGSVGTIAQSEKSDLDIWVCHRPWMRQHELIELEKKCRTISEWALTRNLEVHFFLMDFVDFKEGRLSALDDESSGSTQRLLLLDEFYRSAIYLCGRLPLWWFVPQPQEKHYNNYANTLIKQRFVRDQDTIDFGGVGNIPASEFIGASIWQLYKAIDSPYKSVLKLLLLEAYVNDYPNIQPVSQTFKILVYDGKADIDRLDSYLLSYQRLENYLISQHQPKRLELVRRCFYLKVNKPLSKPPSGKKKSWQRKVLEDLTHDWGWTPQHLQWMDNHKHWKATAVAKERELLVAELTHSYQVLLNFTQGTHVGHALSATELTVLGRKLNAAFGVRPGKVERIHVGISSDLSEEIVVIEADEHHNDDHKTTNEPTPPPTLHCLIPVAHDGNRLQTVMRSPQFMELILWCYLNGIADNPSQVRLRSGIDIDHSQLTNIFKALHHWLPDTGKDAHHQAFERAAQPQRILLLVNIGRGSKPLESQRMSDNLDALRYGSFDENLVFSVDVIIENSWHEITVSSHRGPSAAVDMLEELLSLCLPCGHLEPPSIIAQCIDNTHTNIIGKRLSQWCQDICCCYLSGRHNPARYIFQLADKYYCLHVKKLKPVINTFGSKQHLIEHLGAEQANYSPIVIDRLALTHHPLKIMCRACKPGAVHVFFHTFDIGMEAFVFDECGSVTQSIYRDRNPHNPLKSLHAFMRAILKRLAQNNPTLTGDFGIYPIYFAQLQFGPGLRPALKPKQITPQIEAPHLTVSAIVAKRDTDKDSPDSWRPEYNFTCHNQTFSSATLGSKVFHEVASHIATHRSRNGVNQPIYIADLELHFANQPDVDNHLQLSHYLRIKNALEQQINRALKQPPSR